MKVNNNTIARVKGSRSPAEKDVAERTKTDGSKNVSAASGGVKDNTKQRKGKGKGWRKALTDGGDTTEDAESSALSDLSDSTEDGYDDNGVARSVNGERSEDYELFEKALRSKHSKACKAMSVRSFICINS